MCKAPKPPTPKEPKKPEFLRNRYLDASIGDSQAVDALRTGRASLRIPLGGPTPVGGRQPGESLVSAPPTSTNPANTPPSSGDFRGIGLRRTSGRPYRLT